MDEKTSSDAAGSAGRRTQTDGTHSGEAGAWEALGDGLWQPHRVRGSNRGRALG